MFVHKVNRFLFGVMLALSFSFASAQDWMDDEYEMLASPYAYNRIVLPTSYTSVVIPPSAELEERPMAMGDNKGLLIRPRVSASDIPVIVELDDGEVFTVVIKTDNGLEKGQVFRYRNAPDKSQVPSNEHRANDDFIARVMTNVFEGDSPMDMGEVAKGPSMVFTLDKSGTACNCYPELTLTSIKSYRGAGHWLNVYRLSSDRLIEVDPRDFWRDGVVAVTIQGDVAGATTAPLMAILEVDGE